MGNSEVGHLNIGAGRVIHMDVTRIDLMIASGEFFRDPTLLAAMHHARTRRLHLMGLLSDGGVHSMNTHLYALLEMAKREGVTDVCDPLLHGRPRHAAGKRRGISSSSCSARSGGSAWAASRRSSGRYYAMDRDKRWERIERAEGAMVDGVGEKATDPVAAVKRSYERASPTSSSSPSTIVDARNEPVGLIREEDACIFFNYRADRGAR